MRTIPPPSRLSGGVPVPVAAWSRIMRAADRLGIDAEDLLELALDCFDQVGEAWLETSRFEPVTPGDQVSQ